MIRTPAPSPGAPGASAQFEANRLRREELRFQNQRARRWILPALLLWAVAASVANLLLPEGFSVVVGAIVPFKIFRSLYRPGIEVQRWRAGAAGERRTAQYLKPLLRRGWVILHDRAFLGNGGNLDHLVLTPDGQGALCINTKTTRGGGHVRLKDDALVLGRTSYPKAIKGVLNEAERASRALGVPVQAVIAVHGARVKGGRLLHSSGLLVVAASQLRHQIAAIPHQRSPHLANELKVRAQLALPAYALTTN